MSKVKFKYNKCRITARDPHVGTSGSAGIDFFIPYYIKDYAIDLLNTGKNKENGIYCDPDLSTDFKASESEPVIIVPAGKSVLIPSGIKTIFDPGNALLFLDKSGVCTKRGLKVGACLVDSDYRGELHYHLINTADHDVTIEFGEKIIQALFMPYNIPVFEYVSGYDFDEFVKSESETNDRGEGGFGSTGTK